MFMHIFLLACCPYGSTPTQGHVAEALPHLHFSVGPAARRSSSSCLSCLSTAVCHPGAHAGAHVKTQDLQPQPPGLSQDMSVPKMAENGSSTR